MIRTIASIIAAALLGSPVLAQALTIYTEVFPPDQYLDRHGKLTGFAVEIVEEIQRRTGSQDPIQVVPWVRGYREARQRPNVLLFSMAWSPERKALFEWVGPLRESQNALYVKAESSLVVRSLEEARKLERVGVYKDDFRDQFLTKAGFSNLDRSVDPVIALKKLMANRIDAMAAAPEAIPELLQASGFKPGSIRPVFVFQTIQTYLAFSKGTSRSTIQSWARSLEVMKQEGSFQRIFQRYFPTLAQP